MATAGHVVESAAAARAATSKVVRHPIATTNTCSIRCSSAVGRPTSAPTSLTPTSAAYSERLVQADEKVAAGSQAAHDVGDAATRNTSGARWPLSSGLSIRRGRALLDAVPPVRGAGGAARDRQQPGSDGAQADPARHAGFLSGQRAVGSEPGRPRQPQAGRLPSAAEGADGGDRRIGPGSLRHDAPPGCGLAGWSIKLAVIATLLEYRRGDPDCLRRQRRARHGRRRSRRSTALLLRQRDDAAVLVAASRFPGASEGADAPADETVPIPACFQKARSRELRPAAPCPSRTGGGGAAAVRRSSRGGSGPGVTGGDGRVYRPPATRTGKGRGARIAAKRLSSEGVFIQKSLHPSIK